MKQISAPVGVSKGNTAHPDVIVREYKYNDELTKLEYTVDEFGETTYYTTDDVWGAVTSVTSPDGTIITDTFDGDKSTLLSRKFSNNSNARATTFGYSYGNLDSLTHGDMFEDITFEFEYVSITALNNLFSQNSLLEKYFKEMFSK